MLSDADNRVLGFLSRGPRRAAEVGRACFAPSGNVPQRKLNDYALVAAGHLKRMEQRGLVRKICRGTGSSERVEWEVVGEVGGELF